ncbi:MAG: RecX family transcriptional regulator [Bacteroidales bacterium]|nr:RecX family transcriptional regulator [Bacteroidales bacterium]
MRAKEYTESEILQKAAAYCSVAEHCEQDVRDKITAWGMTETDCQDALVEYLTQNEYLSAERYCKAFVHDKLLYQGWGRQKMRQMLRQKGLPGEQIAIALEDIEEEVYSSVLTDILQKKARSLKKETGDTLRQKLLRFAYSRGFEYPEIEAALRKTNLC